MGFSDFLCLWLCEGVSVCSVCECVRVSCDMGSMGSID